MEDTWYRIDAPTWKGAPVVAVVVRDGVVVACADYLARTAMGRPFDMLKERWERQGAIVTELKQTEECPAQRSAAP